MNTNTHLDRETVISQLRRSRAELESAGARHLALFGSLARGKAEPDSDVDFAVVYDRAKVRSLFDMGGLAARISEIIGTDRIDLADEETLRAPVRRHFEREHVRIF